MKPFFLALVAVVIAVVPQGASAVSEDATQEQVQAALQELSAETGRNVATVDEAAALCDQEKYLETCAEIGKRHDLYDDDEMRQVDMVLTELKGEVSQKLAACDSVECLVTVANDLAIKISAKNPTVASQLSLTTSAVKEKEEIVAAAREAGVRFEDCEAMDPNSASVELLRSCARLAKDSRVQKYIPEPIRQQQETIDRATDLKVALQSGEVACGDGTLDGCGNFCLKSTAAARERGASAIPPVCRQIAERFFGADGVKQLESAYQQVATVQSALTGKLTLVLPDGKELIGREAIKSACDRAFESKNIDLARLCGNFAVQNGFAKPEEVTKGLQVLESFARKGTGVNFNECVSNPRACEDFIPDEHRAEFSTGFRVREIMKSAIGFDPEQCERGSLDEAIGKQCLEGSRRALPELRNIAATSSEAKRIVADVEKHIAQAEFFDQKKGELARTFETRGGPGGCTSESECRLYCADSTHGAECLAFGAQQGVFRGNEIAERFQNYQQSIQQTVQYQGFQPPGLFPGAYYPPGQIPGFTQPGPGFYQPPGQYPGQYPGPSPECFLAIERGDFVVAKEICAATLPLPAQPQQPRPGESVQPGVPAICPAYPYIPCPGGYERETFTNQGDCVTYGQCRPIGWTQPSRQPEPLYCPPPSYWDPGLRVCRQAPSSGVQFPYAFTDGRTVNTYEEARSYCYQYGPGSGRGIAAECESKFGIVYAQTSYAPYTPYPTGPGPTGVPYPSYSPGDNSSGCFYTNVLKNGQPIGYSVHCTINGTDCRRGTADGSPVDMAGVTLGTERNCYGPSSGPYPSYSPGPGSGSCTQELINLLGTGCHNMGNAWFDGQMTRYVFPGTNVVKTCSSDWISSCSGGNTSYPGDANSCPGFSYSRWDRSGRRYCQLNETRSCDYDYPSYLTRGNYSPGECPADDTPSYTPSGSPTFCPSGQWWDPATQSCRSSSPVSQCPSFAHEMGGYCMLNNDSRCAEYYNASSEGSYTSRTCQERSGTGGWTNNPSPQSCPSSQYWYYPPGGGAGYCKYGGEPYPSGSPYPYPTYTYSPPQSCPSGQYWYYPPEGGSPYCKSSEPYPSYSPPPPSSYTPPPSTYTPPPYSPPPPSEAPPPPPPSEAPPPPPPSESPPPPAVLAASIHSCVSAGGAWTGSGCYLPRRVGFADLFLASIAESFRQLMNFFR